MLSPLIAIERLWTDTDIPQQGGAYQYDMWRAALLYICISPKPYRILSTWQVVQPTPLGI